MTEQAYERGIRVHKLIEEYLKSCNNFSHNSPFEIYTENEKVLYQRNLKYD
jgi:hypothetical protein